MPVHSPLRYPGGKAKLTPFIQQLFRTNSILDGHYAEPYAGGAGVALALLYSEYASHIHINDLDRSIFAFWHSVLYETDSLVRLIKRTRVTVREWQRQREIQKLHKHSAPLLELGFSTFFLNRTSRSGIIASGGVIGGLRQDGYWGINARYNSAELIRRIERVAFYKDRITLHNLDAEDFLGVTATELPDKSLTYLDPPYYVKGQQRLYASYYQQEDHTRISEIMFSYPGRWIVSYDAAPEILKLYKRHTSVRYSLRYSAAGSYDGEEAMFFSPDLVLPDLRWLTTDAA